MKKIIFIIFLFLFNSAPAQKIDQKNKLSGEKIMEKIQKFDHEISGKYFKSIVIAYNDFEIEQKNIENFNILIRDYDTKIEVTFMPNLAQGERQIPGGGTSLGRTVTYLISKKDHTIIKSNYQR